MILRDEFYFEPRVISETGRIRWYGEQYTAPEMLCITQKRLFISGIMESSYFFISWIRMNLQMSKR